MKISTFSLLLLGLLLTSCKNEPKKSVQEITPAVSSGQEQSEKAVEIIPVEHASMILKVGGKNIYVDPVGGERPYEGKPLANLILLTDIHGDHLDTLSLSKIVQPHTRLIAPKTVMKKLPIALQAQTKPLENGKNITIGTLEITAIPMYNLREEAKKFHPKGRGNGYVIESGDTRIYISGDTGPVSEMRNLQDIDIAFVCMNLPYTMPVNDAADAVLDFAPKKVYPYHYRGKNGMSDVEKFKNIVQTNNPEIEVVQLDWYPKN